MILKRLFTAVILLVSFFCVERFCHHHTDGFAMVNVYAPEGDNAKWHREGSLPEGIENQTFTYFNSGSQSYVFVSEDGQLVLKLFKFQHMRAPPILDFIKGFAPLDEKRAKKRNVLEKTFNSLCIGYDKLKEETGLVFLHLAKTDHLHKKIVIIDKIGKKHLLDLDRVEFLIQKKGTLAYNALNEWMEKGQVQQAKEAVASLLNLSIHRCKMGIFDKDPDFSTNFGFIDTVPFQMDFGRLSLSEEEKGIETYAPEMIRITRELEKWIRENHPELFETFQRMLDEITKG